MDFRKVAYSCLSLILFFWACAPGNIRSFLEEFRPYADGTYSPTSVVFMRMPAPSEISLTITFPAGYSGQYHTSLYDSTGQFLAQRTSNPSLPSLGFSGLVPGSTYRITVAPWSSELGREGRVDEYVFTQGYAYVNPAAKPGGDGLTWQTAMRDLADGIDRSGYSDMLGVRVAIGTYVPSSNPSYLNSNSSEPEYYHFQLIAGRTIEGGWNPVTNERTGYSTASGDHGGGVHSYHVFYRGTDGAENATLCYFNITGGEADSTSSPFDSGGGLLSARDTRVEHCYFSGNTANSSGGAIYAANNSALSVESTVFQNNVASAEGGAIYSGVNSPVNLLSCVFYQNQANLGYSVYSIDTIIIINSVFYQDFSKLVRRAQCVNNIFNNSSCWINNATFVSKEAGNHVFISGNFLSHFYAMTVFFDIDPVAPSNPPNKIYATLLGAVAYEKVFSNISQAETQDPWLSPLTVSANGFKNIANPLQIGDWYSKACGLMPQAGSVLQNAGIPVIYSDIRGLPRGNPACAGAYEYEQ